MQLWMEINVVTLHKVVETMPQQMLSKIKAKGGLTNCATYFFLDKQYILRCIVHKRKANIRLNYIYIDSRWIV